MPVDPVCGIEMDESLALIHEHDGEKYYFCCNGCKKIFVKKTKKINSEDNITIRTKESLHYYELYKENFKIPECTNGNNQCSDCNAEIVNNSKFCGMCGKFPI